jgi:predicted MFS family arabinose efflux permease
LDGIILRSVLLYALALALFARADQLWAALLTQFVMGLTGIQVMIGCNTLIQTLVEDRLRGRVMSLLGMVFMGAMPLGALLQGKLAANFGAPRAVSIGAMGCLLAGLCFGLALPEQRRQALPVFRARGLMPEE